MKGEKTLIFRQLANVHRLKYSDLDLATAVTQHR